VSSAAHTLACVEGFCESCSACRRVTVAPLEVRRALRRGLELEARGFGGRGLERDTVDEARELASGASCSRAKAEKAVRWHQRNRRFAAAAPSSPAGVAWLLWGGAAGARWFRRVEAWHQGHGGRRQGSRRGGVVEALARGAVTLA